MPSLLNRLPRLRSFSASSTYTRPESAGGIRAVGRGWKIFKTASDLTIRRNVLSSRLGEFQCFELKTSRLSSSRSSHSTFAVSLFLSLPLTQSLSRSPAVGFPFIRLALTFVRQSGNPGIMNSQLSLAIPALPANTTLYEFAQLLAWLFSDVE